MRKFKFYFAPILLIVISLCAVFSGCVDKKIPTKERFNYVESEWNTTFFDNFDGNSVNARNWKINTMASDNPLENGIRRAGYYVDTPDTIFVKDSNLTIRTAYKDGALGKGWYTGWLESSVSKSVIPPQSSSYTGLSQNKGYFEIRCIAPPASGIWSAFWLMPDEGVAFTDNDIQGTATDGLEIDIMESPSYAFNRNSVTHVLHADGYDNRLKSTKSPSFNVPKMFNQMHTYAMEWDENKYTFYIDGFKTWESSHEYNGATLGTSNVLQYMILSVEVGGFAENGVLYPGKTKKENGALETFWAGDCQKNDLSKSYDFIIDYVKVMQRK